MTDYSYNFFTNRSTQSLAQDTYYHTFYQVSQENPNTMITYTYDNSKNLIETFDVSFGAFSVSEALQILDQSGANPYVVGTNSTGTEFIPMDIGYFDIYNRFLTTSQHKGVMTKVNKTDLSVLTDLVIYISPQSQLTNNGTNYTNWVTNYASGSPVSNIRISNVPTTGTYNYNNLSDDITNSIYDQFDSGSTFTNGVFNLKSHDADDNRLTNNIMYFINNEHDFTNGFTIAFRILTDIGGWHRVLQITTHERSEAVIDLTWSLSFRGRNKFPDSISKTVLQTGYYAFTVSSSECVFYYNGAENKTITTTSDSSFKGSEFLSSISSTHKYFRIGSESGFSNMNFDMDAFRIYNKVLSAEDVQNLYNNLP